MSRNFGLVAQTRQEHRHTFNPEAAPEQADGDFPYFYAGLLSERHRDANRAFRRVATGILLIVSVLVAAAFVAAFLVLVLNSPVVRRAHAHDDGGYANTPLKSWFDGLASGKGLCCSFADGVGIEDVDWETQRGEDGNARYRVRLNGQWINVPDAALVTQPNKFGPAVVWPYRDTDGQTQIRCFIPGAGA